MDFELRGPSTYIQECMLTGADCSIIRSKLELRQGMREFKASAWISLDL